MKVYIISSLRNPRVPHIGNRLRELGIEAFDEWHGGGPNADECWKEYEQIRGRSYKEALYSSYATHIWDYDKHHLDTSDAAVMVHPVGRSAHIELGIIIGQNKPAFVLFDHDLSVGEARFDVMYRGCKDVFFEEDELIEALASVAEIRTL